MSTRRTISADPRLPPGARGRGDRAASRTGLYVLVVLTLGVYLPSPLFPAYQETFGISDLAMTLMFATFAVVSAPALLVLGPASDALGARPVLLAALVAAAVGSVCFAFASATAGLVVGRAAQGLALGAATGAAAKLVAERGHGRISGAVLTGVAFVAGTAAGPITGGLLARFAPAPEVLPYLLHIALLALGWWRVWVLRSDGRAQVRRWRPTRPEIPKGGGWLFASAAATGFLAWTVAGLFLAIIPTLLDRAGQTNPAVTGGILGAVLVCSVLSQPFVGRLGARRAQLLGLVALLISLGLLAVTGGGSTSVTLVAAVVAGAGHGLAYGGAAAVVEAVAPPGRHGAVTGALYLAFYLGAGCPAVVVGLVTLNHPLTVAMSWVTAVAAGLVPLAGVAVVYARRATGGAPGTELGDFGVRLEASPVRRRRRPFGTAHQRSVAARSGPRSGGRASSDSTAVLTAVEAAGGSPEPIFGDHLTTVDRPGAASGCSAIPTPGSGAPSRPESMRDRAHRAGRAGSTESAASV